MSPLDQEALNAGYGSNGSLGYADPGANMSRSADPGYEPELEGSTYQTAPITSLALARWSWAVAGLLVGALLGFLSATGGGFKATAQLQINANVDPNAVKSIGQTLQGTVYADDVLRDAVKTLRASKDFLNAGGTLPRQSATEGAAKAQLAGAITATPVANTSLVSIVATDPGGLVAIYEANAVANAVVAKQIRDADAAVKDLQDETNRLIASYTIGPTTDPAETARRAAIATDSGGKMAAAGLTQKQQVSVVNAVIALPDGPDRNVSGLLGAAGGAFLGALAAVAAGAGRRRPHSPRELMSLAPDLTVRTTVQAGELAGRMLETDRRSVAVLAMPDTRFAATQLAMAIAHHLRTHGATVAVVDRVSEFSPTTASEDRLWALRRDVRRNIPANFSADMLVVVCGADEEALSLIAGQSDLLVAVVAKQRKTILADIRRTVDTVRISEPVVVLAR